jgi:hypothetical protein
MSNWYPTPPKPRLSTGKVLLLTLGIMAAILLFFGACATVLVVSGSHSSSSSSSASSSIPLRSQADRGFLAMMHMDVSDERDGFKNDDAYIAMGHEVCADYQQGRSAASIHDELILRPVLATAPYHGFDPDIAWALIIHAGVNYCPEHR